MVTLSSRNDMHVCSEGGGGGEGGEETGSELGGTTCVSLFLAVVLGSASTQDGGGFSTGGWGSWFNDFLCWLGFSPVGGCWIGFGAFSCHSSSDFSFLIII